MSETCGKIKTEFMIKFRKSLLSKLAKFEGERFLRLCISIFLIILALGLIIGSGILHIHVDSDAFFKSVIAIIFILLSIIYCIKKDFENKIKVKIMPTVCKCFENLKWGSLGSLDMNVVKMISLLPSFDSHSFDDVFKGSHNGVNYSVAETTCIKGSGKNKHTVFQGVVILLDMNKKFKGHTLILPDNLLHISPKSCLKHTVLEDVQFEKKFDVYTSDEIEARYLITPGFMERINNLKMSFSAKSTRCAFFSNQFFIALDVGYDLFSLASLTRRIDDPEPYFQMLDEILSVIKLIDHFKLNERIGI